VELARIPVTPRPQTIEDTRDLGAEAQRRIASEAARAQRVNALRSADIALQSADGDYATRAGSNNAHFLLARPDTSTNLKDYAALTLQVGSGISAIGVYSWFHLSALQKASRLANEAQLAPAERAALARSALADEAFALHFLQDVFAAGHIAGTWGSASQRQGTHDYYNQNGLEVFTWSGGNRSVVLMGDAHMRPEDAEIVASTVRVSLEQVLDIASNRPGHPAFRHAPAAPAEPEDFNVCRNDKFPQRPDGQRVRSEERPIFEAILVGTPVPGLGPGFGAMPRFRSEVGPFVGLSGAIDGRVVDGGFVDSETRRGVIAGLDLSFRAGFGLDGVMGDAGDGLVFGSIGFRTDSPTTSRLTENEGAINGNLSAVIPARSGLALRVRMPFTWSQATCCCCLRCT
jgi:hypothetical protein